MLERFAGVLFFVSGLGYIFFPPFYESGVGKLLVPALGFVDLLVAYDLLSARNRFRKYYMWGAVGGLLVAVPFWDKSTEYYGIFTVPMMAIESVFIVAAFVLLVSQVKAKGAKHSRRKQG